MQACVVIVAASGNTGIGLLLTGLPFSPTSASATVAPHKCLIWSLPVDSPNFTQ